MEKKETLTSQQVADELAVPYSTVMLWLKQGRFPGAERDDSNPRGPVWLIPRTALDKVKLPKRGRPAKAKGEGTSKRRRKG
ncbi:MAG TPA: helix-turn-helix domain-containing protein [Blastocatellia bacterium]|nr:helix-turn-helix domain-containing protein [Blastocatellia bacterium]